MEIIICSAIKLTDGRLIRGHRHADCIATIHRMGIDTKHTSNQEGFITSKNRFADRKEAYLLQRKAGIESNCWDGYWGEELFSEDLY